MASRDAFGGFTFAAFKAKNIPAVMVMINPSLIESSLFFSNQNYSFIVYFLLKRMTSFWSLILFFTDECFWCLRSVICKKYTNTNGKDSKYANTIDISIIWLFCRLYCRLFCRLFCRLYCGLFFVMQYFFFPLFHQCSKFVALSDTSRMFFSCYYFFLSFCHFLYDKNNHFIYDSAA